MSEPLWKAQPIDLSLLTNRIVELESALTLATQRAEAAEARCVELAALPTEKMPEREWTHGEWMRNQLSLANEVVVALEAERDALRKDAARLREEVQYVANLAWAANETWEHEKDEELGREIKVIAHALDAALAVQPTTEGL